MKHRWGHTYAGKAAAVVLTTFFLWGTGLSLLGVLIEATNGFVSDPAAVDTAFVQRVASDAYSDLTGYITQTVSDRQRVSANNDYYYEYYAGDINYYRDRFDPTCTNLRFYVTDADGSVILSNDSSYGKNTELLGKTSMSVPYYSEEQDYQVGHVFKDYAALQQADMSSFLRNPDEFQVWYFTDSDVQRAYQEGVEITSASGSYTTELYFESEASAMAYDYYSEFGDQVTWEIVQTDRGENAFTGTSPVREGYKTDSNGIPAYTADDPLSAQMPVKSIITAFRSEEGESTVSIAEYYRMKAAGFHVTATNPTLEQRLSEGLDVTITGKKYTQSVATATVWLPAGLPVDDSIRSNYAIFSLLRGKAEIIIAAMFFFAIATVISAIAMCSAAGHTDGTDTIVVPTFHRLPYGIFWILPILSFFLGGFVLRELWNMTSVWRIQTIFAAGIVLSIAVTSVLWLYTTAVRMKSGTFWSSFGVVRLMRSGFGLLRHKTLTCVLTAVGFTALLLMNGIAGLSGEAFIVLPMLGIDLLALLLVLYCIYSYFTLHQHMRQISLGNFQPERYVIPLAGDFLSFDSELNTLTDSVGEMVARQMKAEHLRTELITNVSHDLKTPLTSIVNYVDLLSREPIQSEEAQEYLEVLRRQAARLKKLTTDLVEASKASTGNLTVEMQTTNVQVLLDQFGGEYEEKLRQSDLELVLGLPDPSVYILADGRLIMRVFDNLLNNACKYAMKGTRVYLDAFADAQTVTITMKNVSAAPLNVSPDELMERFVRGDSSRHTEGSGLGLSIARDLTALQGGTLSLHTDGDLFKAMLTFPRYEPPALPDFVE